MMVLLFSFFAFFIYTLFNTLTNHLCVKKDMSYEKQLYVYRTVNIYTTILLASSYLSITYL